MLLLGDSPSFLTFLGYWGQIGLIVNSASSQYLESVTRGTVLINQSSWPTTEYVLSTNAEDLDCSKASESEYKLSPRYRVTNWNFSYCLWFKGTSLLNIIAIENVFHIESFGQ